MWLLCDLDELSPTHRPLVERVHGVLQYLMPHLLSQGVALAQAARGEGGDAGAQRTTAHSSSRPVVDLQNMGNSRTCTES